MMTLRKFLGVLSICAVSAGRMVVHESRTTVPDGFVSHGTAPADEILTLRVALAANNIEGLEQKLMSLSTPGSSEFRQWLSMDEVRYVYMFYSVISLIRKTLEGQSLRATFGRNCRRL